MTDLSESPRRRFPLEYIVVGVPILVALLHLVMIQSSSQTRWKGGGFGMYADPHPNSYRVVWLVGEDEDGEETAFSLDPFDERVSHKRIDAPSRRVALRVLHDIAEDSKNFPERTNVAAIRAQLQTLRATEDKDRDEELQRVLRLLPLVEVRMRVTEIVINEQYTALEAKPIHEVEIP
jgi:hypothetical protein